MADPVQFDLTCKLIPYLDRHLVFPLLEFLSVQKIYDENDLRLARLDILSNTKMVDFAMDIYKSVYPDEPVCDKLVQQRSKVVARLSKLKALTGPIIQIFEDPEVQKQLQSSRDQASLMQFLTENHNFNSEMLATLHTYAKFHYECGNYTAAADYLYLYRGIIPTNDKKFNLSLWGKLASEILTQNWENALEDLIRLRELTDSTPAPMGDTKTLQQRTWLVHWSLFVFFNHPKGRDMIIEMFLYSAPYLNTIQTTCPHILRYLATAVVINKANRRQAMKDLVRVIQQEQYAYSDPITEFISNLYVDYDFDMAQEQLTKCAVVLENDFFLVACQADFIDNARLMIFELFCRIHQCISINMLAEKLNMTPEAAELWIVNLIRQAKLDAKIDYKNAQVVMDIHSQSPYQQLIDKTKNLSFRTQMLVMNVEKKAAARSNVGSSWHHY